MLQLINMYYGFVRLESHIVMAVLPLDCLNDSSTLKNFSSISHVTLRIRQQLSSSTIEARIEQRSRTNIETMKSVRNLSIIVHCQ
jgi:hypothetical protein